MKTKTPHTNIPSYFNAEWKTNSLSIKTCKIIKGKTFLSIKKADERIWKCLDKEGKVLGWFGIKLNKKSKGGKK